MRTKFKSVIIITTILLSALFVGWNIDLLAKNINDELNNTSTSRTNNLPRAGGFDLGTIEVISEFITNQNSNNYDSNYPKIAVEDDNIYMVWEDRTNYKGSGLDLDIFYRYFDGSEWSEVQVISEPLLGGNSNNEDSRHPAIAVENGKIYIIWQDNNNTNGAGTDADIFFKSNLTGTSWEDIQVISEPVAGDNINYKGSRYPEIAVENDEIYVVWEDETELNNAGDDDDIFFRCNLTGTSWGDIQVISEPSQGKNINTRISRYPDIAVENSKIFVTWQDMNDTNGAAIDTDTFFRCNLTGNEWEEIQVISEPIQGMDFNIAGSGSPAIAVENSKIYIVWFDNNDTDDAGTDSDIFYRCNLTGSSWESIQVISEPIPGSNNNTGDSTSLDIAVENGKIFVVWCDYNNTKSAGTDGDIFYKCNITGVDWEDVHIISEPAANRDINTYGSYSPNIAVNNGKNHIVWYDNNNTNGAGFDSDIFYRYLFSPLYLNFPKVEPVLGNTSTDFNFTVSYFHLNDMAPSNIFVKINDIEYSMLGVDSADTNYLDGKEYYFNIKNLNIGLYKYQFYASDGKFTKLTVLKNKPIVYNTPPNITTEDNITAFEDVNYEVEYDYEDIDVKNVGQVVSWNFSTDAEWLTFDQSTALLNGTPTNDDVGEYWINISINDTIDIDYTNFTLTVINVNDPPNIMTNDIKIAIEDELYELVYEAIDIDTPQNDLIWSMDSNSSWLGFDQVTGKLTGIPGNDDVGDYWVSISVSDTEYINYSNFTLLVINVNDPPKIITKNNITAIEDEFYEVYYIAKDIDNASSQLTWSIFTNAQWLTYNTGKSVINGTPINDDIGEYWVNISVSDNEFIDFTNFTLVVVNTNDPPMIITDDKTNTTAGELYSINYEAEDIDPLPITLTWFVKSNASDWLTIDTYNGWLNGIPSVNDAGIYWVNVTVTDNENGWDYHNFTLEVLKKPFQLNYAPQLFNTSMTPSEGDIKTEFTFSVYYYDVDGDAPVFIQAVIDDIVHTMKLKSGENPSDGLYECKTTLSEGIHSYYFTAFDGLESVKTNNMTTPDIKNIEKISTEETSWYWLFLIVIIIIIIGIVIALLIMKKRKAIKLPTIQAEILRTPPEHIALPGTTPSADIATSLSAQPIVSEQLPTPKVQVQPSDTISSETISALSLAPTTIETQFQLPKATLSKAQELHLLRERFLKGEVTEETYYKLRSEIEAQTGEDITKDDLEEQSNINEQQQTEVAQQPEINESIETQPKQQPTDNIQQEEILKEKNNSQSSNNNQKLQTSQEKEDKEV